MSTETRSLGPDGSLPPALMLLTVLTGLVDAISFLGLGHVFTANMTGNVVFLGFAIAGSSGLSVPRTLTSLIAFLCGAILGGRVAAAMAASRRRWLVTVAVVEAGLLLASSSISIWFGIESATPSLGTYGLIGLLAVAMGLRNATVRRLAVPDMTTTVLTQTLTGLAAESSLAGGVNPRTGRRIASVFLIFAGAATGTLLLKFNLSLPLVVGCVIALGAAVVFAQLRARTAPTGHI